MQPIKTASTVERIIRNGIVTAMVVGFGAYFLYDGYIGYVKDNLEAAKQELPAEAQDQARINPRVVESRVVEVTRGMAMEDVRALFGEPCWTGPGKHNSTVAVWFGPAGVLKLRYNAGDRVVWVEEWSPGKHSEVDLAVQKVLGYALCALGLVLVVRWILMLVWGAELNERGLKPSGRALIPFEAMNGWDTSEYKKKGRIRLNYSTGQSNGTYVLDDYKLRAFPEIVRIISERKGYENPVRPKSSQAPEESKPEKAG